MELRDYQRACLEAVRDAYRRGVRRALVCLPTGTGKTVVFAQIPRFFRMQKRMLVLAHREELLAQAQDKIARANPGLTVAIEQGEQRAQPGADVVVASVATIGKSASSRLERLPKDEFTVFVVDEAHHAIAPTYRRVLEHFGALEAGTKKLVVGFTATPRRGDGKGLDTVFEEIVFSRDLSEMIAYGWLAPVAAWRVETGCDISSVKTRHGDFVSSQLSAAVNVAERNDLVVSSYQRLLSGRQTICFCVDVAHAISLARAFTDAGVPAEAVTGAMAREDRASVLRRFRERELRVVTNCMVLTEGYDEPSVGGVLLARPTRSALLYMQMVGRGTRLHPGKENVVVVDIVDMTREHGSLVTLPTLFGLPASFDLEGRTTREATDALRWTAEHRPWIAADLARSMSDLRLRCKRIDLLDLDVPPELDAFARFAWSREGPNGFRLNLRNAHRIVVARTLLGEWEAMEHARGVEPRLLTRQRDLRRAISVAEASVADDAELARLLDRDGRWRHMSASDKQRALLAEKGIATPPGLTKGQASHVIATLLAR